MTLSGGAARTGRSAGRAVRRPTGAGQPVPLVENAVARPPRRGPSAPQGRAPGETSQGCLRTLRGARPRARGRSDLAAKHLPFGPPRRERRRQLRAPSPKSTASRSSQGRAQARTFSGQVRVWREFFTRPGGD